MTRLSQSIYPVTGDRAWPLYSLLQTQALESQLTNRLPPHSLMQRAGKAAAQLALAIAPHAKKIWVACGPGNNGGDGLEAAIHLINLGKQVTVTYLGQPNIAPSDAKLSWQRAIRAGVQFEDKPIPGFDLAIDALLGLGCDRKPVGKMAEWLQIMRSSAAPVLSIDLPTGLLPDTGEWLRSDNTPLANTQFHTLSLLTLKMGLFTADGLDAAGQVWFIDLTQDFSNLRIKPPGSFAQLQSRGSHQTMHRVHNSHKGNYGDLMVIGGAPGMTGAAILAGIAGLHGGAGRVFLTLLDKSAQAPTAIQHPALMARDLNEQKLQNGCVICGCGASDAVRQFMPRVLSESHSLLLDADALNAISVDSTLMELLKNRALMQRDTVITPHPLEAARLLGCTVSEVQRNRVQAGMRLAKITQAIVVLKGSGTVICSPIEKPVINSSGNSLLATAGTGDVLAGVIGAQMAQGQQSFAAACDGVRIHGAAADSWALTGRSLDAVMLAKLIH